MLHIPTPPRVLIAVLATSMFGWVLLSESALSFLGLGVAPPAPTWGNMLAGARSYIESAVWTGVVPGACIALTLLGINLLGDAVRDRFLHEQGYRVLRFWNNEVLGRFDDVLGDILRALEEKEEEERPSP